MIEGIDEMQPAAVAVLECDFMPIALAIRELQKQHDWPLGPAMGGVLLYVATTLKSVNVPSDDPFYLTVIGWIRSIADGRAAQVIEGN